MTDALTCDILVVGAGPAGGAAALAAARRGLRVLLAERRQAVGTPVQCAEFIPAMLLGHIEPGDGFIAQRIRGMRTFLPGEPAVETRAPGFTVHRDLFDRAMVQAAVDAGAELMLAARALRRNGDGSVLLRKGDGRHLAVKAAVVVGADGPRSTVARWAGRIELDLIPGIQVSLPLAEPSDWTEVYFEPEFFAGYGWLFPKRHVANIGIGMKPFHGRRRDIRAVLDRFIARLRAEGRVAGTPARYAAGWIPAGPVRRAVYGNIMLAGDAAGHTHPVTGAGIAAAVVCGGMAGEWAARAVENGDIGRLRGYDDAWRDLFGRSLDRAYRRRQAMEAGWEDFHRTVRSCWIAFRDYHA